MRRFSQVIDDLELRDFPVQSGQYTWKGGLNNCRMARLNRFLVSEEWDCLFDGTRQSILPRPTSDHFPILIEGGCQRDLPLLDSRICGLKRRVSKI